MTSGLGKDAHMLLWENESANNTTGHPLDDVLSLRLKGPPWSLPGVWPTLELRGHGAMYGYELMSCQRQTVGHANLDKRYHG